MQIAIRRRPAARPLRFPRNDVVTNERSVGALHHSSKTNGASATDPAKCDRTHLCGGACPHDIRAALFCIKRWRSCPSFALAPRSSRSSSFGLIKIVRQQDLPSRRAYSHVHIAFQQELSRLLQGGVCCVATQNDTTSSIVAANKIAQLCCAIHAGSPLHRSNETSTFLPLLARAFVTTSHAGRRDGTSAISNGTLASRE